MANEINSLPGNGEIVLAQAQTNQEEQTNQPQDLTQPQTAENADLPQRDGLAKPAAGEQVTVPVTANERITVEFNPDDAQIVEEGNNLTFLFSDGSAITLTGFVALSLTDTPPSFVLSDGTVLAGNIVVASLRGVSPQELEPAAGEPGATGSGGSTYSDNFGDLIDGLHAQGPLPGEGFPRFTPTLDDPTEGTPTQAVAAAVPGENDVTFDVSDGGDVYESGLADGSHVPAAQPITDGGDLDINDDTVTLGYTITAGGQTINSGTGDSIVIEDAQGRLTILADGTYSYALLDNFDHTSGDVVPVSFDITVTDANGNSASDTLVVNVHDDAPIANDDADMVQSGGTTMGNVLTGVDPDVDAVNQGAQVSDVPGADNPGAITTISNGTDTAAVTAGGTSIVGQHGTLTVFTDGSYEYQAFADADPTDFTVKVDVFSYTTGDTDGDSATAELAITVKDAVLVVGSDDNDVDGTATEHTVQNPYAAANGDIGGNDTSDILVGDVGGSSLEVRDANVIIILDTSLSMDETIPFDGGEITRLEALQNAVNAMLDTLAASTGGTVRVHFVSFGTETKSEATFDITDADGLTDAHDYINGLETYGYTNYEAGLDSAIDWAQSGDPLAGADVVDQVLFVTDGLPNYGLEEYFAGPNAGQNNPFAPESREGTAMNEVLGINPAGPDNGDNTNEIAILESVFGPIDAVGINIDAGDPDALGVLDLLEGETAGSGVGDNIATAEELSDVLADLNPLLTLSEAGNDNIVGGAGDDLIFGDVLYTDTLAANEGLATNAGAGWQVFAQLEAGAGNDSTYGDWSRAHTIQYIEEHAEELAAESNVNGQTRAGGDDIIMAGAGNDRVFGQEGDDMITGGSGNDVLSGGSGNDTFIYNDVLDGQDIISDFVAGGDVIDLDALLDNLGYADGAGARAGAINLTETAGDTVITVNASGGGEIAGFSITVEGVTGLIAGADVKVDDSGLA